ncbi:hypothetical protein [Alloalcanivorax mobilis]|uniref:hypothetical protein n=1 Tax=Alloalcanivorax mobilis TaxID=2019569 RepID=UPI000C76EF68|nr:hypothetical protein [Alloalcanivorax mobilis]
MAPSPRHRHFLFITVLIMAWSLLVPGPARAMHSGGPAMPCHGADVGHRSHAVDLCQHANASANACHCPQACQAGALLSDAAMATAPAPPATPVISLPGLPLTGFSTSPWRPPTS